MTPAQVRAVRHAEGHGGAALTCSRCLWSGVVKTIEFGPQTMSMSGGKKLRCPMCGTDCDLLLRSRVRA